MMERRKEPPDRQQAQKIQKTSTRKNGANTMAMKSPYDPRRAYNRHGITHVTFKGAFYGPGKAESKINIEYDMTCIEGDKKGTIEVRQAIKGKRVVTETWREVEVPRTPRAAA